MPKYSNYYSFKDQIWHQDSSIVFNYNNLSNTNLKFEISISYSNSYPFQNLYASYSLLDSEKNIINTKMIELQLFDKKNGIPLGSGIYNNFVVDSIFLQTDQLIENEKYQLLVKHSMRENYLNGVIRLGISITD
tara:strand:- start:13755 stop:14156 length:402 start_codon:yes stop_codon:yes gene_type:complete